MRLTSAQLEFLARFSKAPEARLLVQLLQAKLGDRESKLRTAVGEEVYRAQGRALELDELIADILEAQARLTRSASPLTSAARHQALQTITG
jgi:hypothetical protein